MDQFLKEFQEWIDSLPVQEIKYFAVFDQTGNIIGIYPNYECEDKTNKIEVDESIALSIYEGKTNLSSYVVDLENETLEFVEIKSLKKIDDVIHRIIDKRWSDIENAEVELVYDRNNSLLKIKLDKKFKTKKIFWDGSTDMKFIIADYNDPNVFYDMISFTINDIVAKEMEFSIDLPKNYSIYTRRIFKNYVIEEV